MIFFIWLIVAGVIGWLASLFMKTNGQHGMRFDSAALTRAEQHPLSASK